MVAKVMFYSYLCVLLLNRPSNCMERKHFLQLLFTQYEAFTNKSICYLLFTLPIMIITAMYCVTVAFYKCESTFHISFSSIVRVCINLLCSNYMNVRYIEGLREIWALLCYGRRDLLFGAWSNVWD